MSKKATIRRAKGVEICAELLFAGRTRKEIVEEFAKSYEISVSSVDNWIKAARPIVAERQAAVNAEQARIDKEMAEASAKRLNITQEKVAEQYAKIAFYDPEAELKELKRKAAAGEIPEEEAQTYGQLLGIKAADVNKALDNLCRMFGYNAPEKAQVDHTTNGQTIHTTFIVKRRSERDSAGD